MATDPTSYFRKSMTPSTMDFCLRPLWYLEPRESSRMTTRFVGRCHSCCVGQTLPSQETMQWPPAGRSQKTIPTGPLFS